MKEKLKKLKHVNDRLDKVVYFVAILAGELSKFGIKPVLVGGSAVEFYTQGSYATLDIDLVVEGRDQAKRVLSEMGFVRVIGERHWYSEELLLSVEIPGDTLAGSLDRILSVDTGDGLTAYIIGIEDLIIDRLNAYKYWNSLSDGEWAVAMLLIHHNDIDFGYLTECADKKGAAGELQELINKARQYKDKRRKR